MDGQRLPLNVKLSKDLLQTLKTIALVQKWRIHYDPANGVISLNTASHISIIEQERHTVADCEMDSTRLLGKVICIDPGHGGKDPGAIGPTGTYEKENTLAIGLLLCEKLERNGAKVYMTRDTDKNVAHDVATAEQELEARIAIAKQAKADLFVSIHNDGFISPTANGATTYHNGSPESTHFASFVQQKLVDSLSIQDRGSRFASFYVIRRALMPAVLVEVAFISNPDEEMLLASDDGRSKAASGLFEGIVSYYKV